MASRRKRLLLILLPLLLLAGPAALIGSLFLQARRTLDAHALQSRAVLESFPAEFSGRPAIFDPPETGDAWDLELQALARISGKTIDPNDHPLRHRFVGFEAWTLSEPAIRRRARRHDTSEPVLDLLRSALRRRSATPGHRPGWGLDHMADDAIEALRDTYAELHFRGRDLDAFERLILGVGLAQDLARHGDMLHRSTLWVTEVQAAFRAKDILEAHVLTPHELELVATWLDRLSAARPPLSRTMAIENALERVCTGEPTYPVVIQDPVLQSSPTPTWRELRSPLIRDAKKVTILARIAADLEGFQALPPWEREAAVKKRLDAMDLGTCQSWQVPQPIHYQYEARALTWMTMLRVAVAVAWYESERGKLPATLQDLVPRHLPAVPPCPLTGRPVHLERDALRFDLPADEKPEIETTAFIAVTATWRIARKKKRD
jgi:hypothetical protein